MRHPAQHLEGHLFDDPAEEPAHHETRCQSEGEVFRHIGNDEPAGESSEHVDLAHGEIHELEQAPYQGETNRKQGEYASLGYAVDDLLQKHRLLLADLNPTQI